MRRAWLPLAAFGVAAQFGVLGPARGWLAHRAAPHTPAPLRRAGARVEEFAMRYLWVEEEVE